MSTIPSELTTREALHEWLLNFHAASKTLDSQVFSMFFTTDAELKFGNNLPVKGREAIQGNFGMAFQNLDLMIHNIVTFDFVPEPEPKIYQAVTIKYVVKGDDLEKDIIQIPAFLAGCLAVEDEALKLKKADIYLDFGPIFARMTEKGLLG